MRWLVVVIRLPANPSRHRVGVWRELRHVGAIPLGGGVWAMPAAPVFATGLDKSTDLVARAEGQLLTFEQRSRCRPQYRGGTTHRRRDPIVVTAQVDRMMSGLTGLGAT